MKQANQIDQLTADNQKTKKKQARKKERNGGMKFLLKKHWKCNEEKNEANKKD